MEAETDRYKGQLLDRELSLAHTRFEGDPENYLKLLPSGNHFNHPYQQDQPSP